MDQTDQIAQGSGESLSSLGRRGRPALRHLVQGLLLATGAPGGWLILRLLGGAELASELKHHALLYAYLLLSTTIVFSLFGWLLGVKETQLNRLIVQLDHQSVTDPLTGLYNRRYFFDRAEELCERVGRRGRPFALAIVDLDHFKTVNDRFGHLAGDRVLRAVSEILSAHVRRSEVVARIGGEEFGVLFPESSEAEALDAIERLLQGLAGKLAASAGLPDPARVTASAGIVHTGRIPGIPNPSRVLAAADKALYRAKDLGRDKAVLWAAATSNAMRLMPPAS